MSGTLQPQPIPSTPGVPAPVVATATSNQLSRLGQATRQGAGLAGGVQSGLTASTFLASTTLYAGANCSGGAVTLTLPGLWEYPALFLLVRQEVGGNNLTLAANPATNPVTGTTDTVNSAASVLVTKMVLVLPNTNGNWFAIPIED